MPRLLRNGVGLDYEVRGRGRPILLLHGFSSSYQGTWESTGWVDVLVGSGFQTVGLDIRGHGASDKPHDPQAYTTTTLVDDAVAVLDELGIENNDVLGYSMGGGVALRLAMDHPHRVRSVVVGGVGDAALDRFADLDELAEIADALIAATDDEVLSAQARRLRENAVRGQNDFQALAAFMRNGRGWPGGLDELRPIAAPVLIVAAADDEYMRGHAELARGIPHAEVVTLPGAGHHSAVRDLRFRQAVLAFLHGERSGFR